MVGILFRFLLGVCPFSGAFAVSFREGNEQKEKIVLEGFFGGPLGLKPHEALEWGVTQAVKGGEGLFLKVFGPPFRVLIHLELVPAGVPNRERFP